MITACGAWVARNLTSELEILDLENVIRELEIFFQNFDTRPSVSSYSSALSHSSNVLFSWWSEPNRCQ